VLGVTVDEHTETGWIEGFAILVAVFVVSIVAAGNDWTKDRKFRSLEAVKDDRKVKVIRSGTKMEVSTYDLVVGDVCLLTTGDWVPADMIVVDSHSLSVDESSMTGEPVVRCCVFGCCLLSFFFFSVLFFSVVAKMPTPPIFLARSR
jgi:magnesium-transporting ATPase (P-type)